MRRAPDPRLAPRALLLAFLFGALLATGLTPIRPAAVVSASTPQVMAADLLGWINAARTKRGLGALRNDSRLAAIAAERSATLAKLNQLSHEAAGCLTCELAARNVAYNLMGEVLASNTYPWGSESASIVFSSWRNSQMHWDILMGSRWDSIGIGVSRSANGTTYASAVLIDAPGVSAIKAGVKAVVTHPHPRPTSTPAPAAPVAPPIPVAIHREGSVLLGRIPC